jgi:hypothetical protein
LRDTGEPVTVAVVVVVPDVIVAVMVNVSLTRPVAVGVNTTSMLQEPGAVGIPVVTHVEVVVVDTENADDEKTRFAAGIGATVVVASPVSVSVCGAVLTLTKVVPNANGPPVTVAVCPKAAAATKRRVPTICAGTLSIEFLK